MGKLLEAVTPHLYWNNIGIPNRETTFISWVCHFGII